eukprot:6740244-Pyramimonas_sp.AAC.1
MDITDRLCTARPTHIPHYRTAVRVRPRDDGNTNDIHRRAPIAALPWERAKEMAEKNPTHLVPPQTGPRGAEMS